MLDRLNESLNFYGNALSMRGERQRVLASNIANADTPGYKARDFDFGAALEKATANRSSGGQGMHVTDARHISSASGGTPTEADMQYRNPVQPSADGNTVDMNGERQRFMDNSVHYRADLQILGSQIKGLKSAMEPIR